MFVLDLDLFLNLTQYCRFTDEKFDLYKSYQREIHNEQDEKSPESFLRFLVHTPLLVCVMPILDDVPDHPALL